MSSVKTSPNGSWRSSLGFSDRMSLTLEITRALQIADSGLDDTTARSKARAIENDAFQAATSRSAYDDECQEAVQRFKNAASQTESGGEEVNTPTSSDRPPRNEPDLASPAQGQRIGPYADCHYHKTGVFSAIYRCYAKDATGETVLAVKVTTPSSEQPPHDSRREVRLLRSLSHPNIIKLLDSHKLSDGHLLLVFPFVSASLEDALCNSKSIPLRVIHDIFSALAYLHKKGLLHRDLKPSNILLSTRTSSKNLGTSHTTYLADFGIAWCASDPASEPADSKITDISTTCYRAPELLFGRKTYSEGVDLWSAGCVVAEVLMNNVRVKSRGSQRDDTCTLFNAGDLGSELALVKSIFETLGTPDEQSWPETTNLPDWGKMSFISFPAKSWSAIMPGVDEEGLDLVQSLVQYESGRRTPAAQVLEHPYLRRSPIDEHGT